MALWAGFALAAQTQTKNTAASAASGAGSPPAAARADSPTSKSKPSEESAGMSSLPFDLGALGSNVKWSVAPLRGEQDTSSFLFDPVAKTLVEILLNGLVHIETENAKVDCEAFSYNGTDKRMTARYNVVLDYSFYDLKANCGQLVYDLATDEITLSVNPEVNWRGSWIRDRNAIIIKRFPNGLISLKTVSMTHAEVHDLGAVRPGARADDRPTSTAPRDITPDSRPPSAALPPAAPTRTPAPPAARTP